jgi:AcrR family transcriptional regulator
MQVEKGTRERILAAAAGILQDPDAGDRMTVRAVASRAGVGVGTLRHHFPTQRALLDAVLAHVYEAAMPDDRIHDSAVPARQRLLDNLRQLLAPFGTGDQARELWEQLSASFIGPSASERTRSAYPLLAAQAGRRVESWLAVLVAEGVLEPGDNAARAAFLLTVVNGLALGRALPSAGPVLEVETGVLGMAVDALALGSDRPPASGQPGRSR